MHIAARLLGGKVDGRPLLPDIRLPGHLRHHLMTQSLAVSLLEDVGKVGVAYLRI